MSFYADPESSRGDQLADIGGEPLTNPIESGIKQIGSPPVAEERTVETVFDREQIIEAAKGSLDFLAAMSIPDVYAFGFPPMYLAIWQLLTERAQLTKDFTKLAIGLPRGHGKTIFLKLFILYLILFTDRKFILVVAATATLAENIIADVVDMLEEQNIQKTFGNWQIGIEKDTQGLKKFGFRGRNIILAALGSGGSPRGLNIKFVRPDFILMDDVQTRENADSEEQSDQLLRWLMGTLMKTNDPHRCMYVYLGNMYPTEGCILKKLKNNPAWISLITGAILADGSPIWPELKSLEQLMAEFEDDLSLGHPEIFMAEVLNDEDAGSKAKIDISKIPKNPYLLGIEEPQGRMVIIDPSTDKVGADDQVIGLFEVFDGAPVYTKMKAGSYTPLECIKVALTMCFTHRCQLVAVEDVAYQSTLLFWFNFICEQLNIEGIHFVGVKTKGVAKNSRIMAWFKNLLKGETYLGEEVRSYVLNQIVHFDPKTKQNKDDALDVGAYALPTWQEYGHLAVVPDWLEAQEFENSAPMLEFESCEF